MPEIITKYPEIALEVLKSAGAKCGTGEKKQILTKCPDKNFCALPQGEICVYGIKDIKLMTQINPTEFADVISDVPTIYGSVNVMLLIASCLLGLFLGTIFGKK